MVPVTSKASNRLKDPAPLANGIPTEHVGITQQTSPIAKVQPLDVTGVRTVAVGACLWLVGLVALVPFYPTLQDQGRGWWLWTCLAGFGLGLVGLEYCRRRRDRLATQPEREVETSPLGAAGL